MKIADIVFETYCEQSVDSFRLEGLYADFLCSEAPEVSVYGHYNGFPEISLREENIVFDSNTFWSFYSIDSRPVLVLRSADSDGRPVCMSLFNTDFTIGKVYYSIPDIEKPAAGLLPHPLAFPVFHILMISLLAQGYGVLIHASGIDDGGRGYLFPASSSHGKTTMARLWRDKAIILNDERIILRLKEGRPWIYGTPWHGELQEVSPRGVPLDKIFFLNKAKTNKTHSQKNITAASSLMSHCFLPFWDRDGIQFTLGFCSLVSSDIPCHMLDFVPNENIVDFVRCVK